MPGKFPCFACFLAIQERSIDFHGDEILATMVESENTKQVYIPLRPICDYLGLSWPGQRERINRDLVLSQEIKGVRVTRTPDSNGVRLRPYSHRQYEDVMKFLEDWQKSVQQH